jgi:hypothetical protein
MNRKRGALLLCLCLSLATSGALSATTPCDIPQAPDLVKRDVTSRIKLGVGKWAGIKAAEVDVETQTVMKDVIAKHPDLAVILRNQTSAAVYCHILLSSTTIPDKEKAELWRKYSLELAAKQPSSPVTGGSDLATKGTLHRVVGSFLCPSVPWIPIASDGSVRMGLEGTTMGTTPRSAVILVQTRIGTGDAFATAARSVVTVGTPGQVTLPNGTKLAIDVSDVYECQTNYAVSKLSS